MILASEAPFVFLGVIYLFICVYGYKQLDSHPENYKRNASVMVIVGQLLVFFFLAQFDFFTSFTLYFFYVFFVMIVLVLLYKDSLLKRLGLSSE